jgi:hypothetical protein
MIDKNAAEDSQALSTIFPWLLRLWWGAVACQTLLIGEVALFLKIRLPLTIIFNIIAFQNVSNILLSRYQRLEPSRSLELGLFLPKTLVKRYGCDLRIEKIKVGQGQYGV